MELPPHISICYKPAEGGPAVKITTMAQYDQLMNQVKRGQKVHFISIIFEDDYTTKSVRLYYNKQDKEYEFEYESHDEGKTLWIDAAHARTTIAAYITQLI